MQAKDLPRLGPTPFTKLTNHMHPFDVWEARILATGCRWGSNERVYSHRELKDIAFDFMRDHLPANTAPKQMYGEFGANFLGIHIDLAKISHEVIMLEMRDNEMWAGIRTIPTPTGIELLRLFNNDIKFFPYMRGFGNVDTDNDERIVSELQIVTVDIDLQQNLEHHTDSARYVPK
jgi:hypothetical protein